MWVARDKENNALKLWTTKPIRAKEQKTLVETTVFGKEFPIWQPADRWVSDPREVKETKLQHDFVILDSNLYPELTWEDDPVEMELFPKDKPSDYVLDKVITLADIFTGFYVFFAATPDKCPLHDKDILREEWKNLDNILEKAKKGDWSNGK